MKRSQQHSDSDKQPQQHIAYRSLRLMAEKNRSSTVKTIWNLNHSEKQEVEALKIIKNKSCVRDMRFIRAGEAAKKHQHKKW